VNNTQLPTPKKIALIGTSCVGKTTILKRVKKYFSDQTDVLFLTEAARIFFHNNPNLPDRFASDVQIQIQQLVIQREREAQQQNPTVIVSDRSVLDPTAYAKANGDETGSETLIDNVTNWIPTYSKFLLLDPKGVPFKNDFIRNETIQMRQAVHDAFVLILKKQNIPYTLITGKREDRVKQVISLINAYL
jgi:nicotinamide riboside kinase